MPTNRWEKKEEQPTHDHSLLCTARDCPMEWTSDFDGRLCTYHAATDPREWPRVTAGLQSQEHLGTLPSFAKLQNREVQDTGERLTAQQKREAVLMLGKPFAKDPKAWAHRLRDREQAGDVLSKVQREAWRTALKIHA